MPRQSLKVDFLKFRISEISAKELRPSVATEKGGAQILVAPEVIFGRQNSQKKAPFHVVVIVQLKVILSEDLSRVGEKTLPILEANIEGRGEFQITGVGLRAFLTQFDNAEFQDGLADRVYPLTANRLLSLLDEMGYSTKGLPLNLPMVETRERILPNGNKTIAA